MVKVYGYSDDILVIEGSKSPYDEIDCYEEEVTLWFTDGTIIKCGYPKEGKGIWYIRVVSEGCASYTLKECDDEDAEVYSDVFEIDAEITKWCLGSEGEEVADLKLIFEDIKNKYPLQTIYRAYEEAFDEFSGAHS